VSRITCGLGRGAAIVSSSTRRSGMSERVSCNLQQLKNLS